MVNRNTRRALALAGGRPHRPTRIVVRRSVMPDEATEPPATEPPESKPEPARIRPKTNTRATKVGDRRRSGKATVARGSRRRLTRWVSVIVLAAALLAIAVQGRQWYELRQVDSARQQALAAARQTTVNFVTISADSVDRDLQRVADGATGDFKDEFTKGMAQVRAAVIENKVNSHGTVLRAAIVSSDRSSAVVLVAVDAEVRNVNAPDGRLTHYRIRTDLALVGGAWLVSKLEFVG
jgi:Mce-associated membrane protein